jgi:hypothetical protein
VSFHSQTPRQALKNAYKNRETLPNIATFTSSIVSFHRATIHNIHALRSAVTQYQSKTLLRNTLADSAIIKLSAQSTYAALLADFEPRRGGGIFGADRVDIPSFVHHSNVATCIRALIPLSVHSVPLLDRAVFSLLSLYYGFLHGNAGLVQLARSSYTVTLGHYSQQLTTALSLPKKMHSLSYRVLICASIALQFLEHLNDVDVHGQGHLAHIDGALSMLKDVGAELINSSTDIQAAFCGFRGIVAFVAIERRAPNFLGETAWLHTPWEYASKTMRDRLNDIGLLIPGELQSTDNLVAEMQNGKMTPMCFVDLSLLKLNAISAIQRRLDDWLYHLKMETEGPLYWPLLNSPVGVKAQADLECQPTYSNNFHRTVFSCGPIAGILAQFWSFQLELLLTRITLHEKILQCCDEEHPILPSARNITLKSLDRDSTQADGVARLILQAEPRLSSCFEGLLCIQAPLRSVVRYLEHSYPRNEDLRHASALGSNLRLDSAIGVVRSKEAGHLDELGTSNTVRDINRSKR